MGDKEYHYIDIPLELHYFYKNCADDIGAWSGKSNLALAGSMIPQKHIASLKEAFEKMSDYKNRVKQTGYQYGIVIDLKSKTVYYDHPDTARFWWQHLNHLLLIDSYVEVAGWETIPK